MRKIFLTTPVLLAIIGCATTPPAPKIEMSLAEYQQRAKEYSMLDTCLKRDYIDSQTHGKAMSIYNSSLDMSGKLVDKRKLSGMINETNTYVDGLQSKMNREMSPENLEKDRNKVKFICQKLAGEIQVGYSEIQDLNRQIQRQNEIKQQQQNQIYVPAYNKSSTTSCNQFGSQVICNTY